MRVAAGAPAERVAADPSLVPALVEEGLRYDTPVQMVFRNATRESEIRGVRVPEGAALAVFLGLLVSFHHGTAGGATMAGFSVALFFVVLAIREVADAVVARRHRRALA